jgi:ubiquinone/menaquinone biosynthesis C-methylase UbiE
MERIPEVEEIGQTSDARRFNQVMGKSMVQQEYRQMARLLLNMGLPSPCRVLDVGTGTGYLALHVAAGLQPQGKVLGLDLSAAMLDLARENALARSLEGCTSWKLGDAAAMPFEDAGFDAVISSGSLHHWSDPVAVFNEIARVLKPEGKVIVRDSKRIHGPGLSTFFASLIGLTLPPDFRFHYWGSIRSSYTPAELRPILDRSRLKDSRISEDLLDLMVIME